MLGVAISMRRLPTRLTDGIEVRQSPNTAAHILIITAKHSRAVRKQRCRNSGSAARLGLPGGRWQA